MVTINLGFAMTKNVNKKSLRTYVFEGHNTGQSRWLIYPLYESAPAKQSKPAK